jgi:hypothetical protein
MLPSIPDDTGRRKVDDKANQSVRFLGPMLGSQAGRALDEGVPDQQDNRRSERKPRRSIPPAIADEGGDQPAQT